MFGCSSCDFYLDILCASLPTIIRHEAHQRALASRKVCNVICSICSGNVQGFVFECGGCSFILCYFCALLPSKFTHRWDKHPFLLTYSPVENHMDEYYCEMCEREVNPKRWFYHCVDCDQSFHTGCVETFFSDLHLNVKFGDTLKVDKHSHLLSCVRCPKNNCQQPSCNSCGGLLLKDSMAFECAPCK
ncbi:protein VACUOLELESS GAMETOPHYTES-like [Rhododendron vialii]|uniref:protein VACUOLELESS GAMETOPHYTES-like n=1 Tax=Rhododendron vialii TaxID=182163 RepID=UPI00265DBD4C|nr:protein VACUOLELESS GAMETOPHYTES-like [Rhododendron vialii]